MLCKHPFRRGAQEFSCGRCMPCRITHQQLWAVRIQLEAASYRVESSFATLTYDPEHLPAFGSLSRAHWREFSKGIGFRYFAVGEYGDRSMRPHYHVICFGREATEDFRLWLESRWGKGHVDLISFAAQLARYIAGYTLKKLTKVNDPRLSSGMEPEFSRMSRRPALGSSIVPALARATMKDQAATLERGDVVKSVRLDGKLVPVGRTLMLKTRSAVSLPESWKDMRARRAAALVSSMTYEYPELGEDKEVKRITQTERAEGLARLSRRSKI